MTKTEYTYNVLTGSVDNRILNGSKSYIAKEKAYHFVCICGKRILITQSDGAISVDGRVVGYSDNALAEIKLTDVSFGCDSITGNLIGLTPNNSMMFTGEKVTEVGFSIDIKLEQNYFIYGISDVRFVDRRPYLVKYIQESEIKQYCLEIARLNIKG